MERHIAPGQEESMLGRNPQSQSVNILIEGKNDHQELLKKSLYQKQKIWEELNPNENFEQLQIYVIPEE